ncbi:unnamed protein product [Phytophthora fragariaefolia]|uniref:Unnamed protein product n=1 Tax=Phytophthora fragariaefolia TaxID=1490495 RepID=A0A9W6UBB7_9STRA|nr:unnamed protein product [Phytophthora fragariaefolia]
MAFYRAWMNAATSTLAHSDLIINAIRVKGTRWVMSSHGTPRQHHPNHTIHSRRLSSPPPSHPRQKDTFISKNKRTVGKKGMALPLPTGFDPSKMMQFLASLPEEEQTGLLQGAMDQLGDFQQRAAKSRTREGLVQRFREARARFVRPGGIFAEERRAGQMKPDGVQISLSNTDAKPNLDMKSLKSLQPMISQELVVGTTHRGRYLCGWVAVDDAFFGIASSSLLLEDVTGQLVEIAAYGLPYYKVRQDLSEGIRVEQPMEMIPWREVPTDLEGWKKLGNEFFSVLNSVNEGRGALACYKRAIQQMKEEVGKIAVLLNNIATCRCKVGDYKAAVQLAGTAVHLDPSYVKGWFRLASALADQSETSQGGSMLATRVVAHACKTIPLSPKERRLLEGTLKKNDSITTPYQLSSMQSYAEWCGCYRKGLAAHAACYRDVGLVLNNIAAVHTMLHSETSVVPGISVGGVDTPPAESDHPIPDTEAALLHSTIAGIIDPLNFKAWARRARCLQKLGLGQEKCVADLNAIRASVVSRAFSPTESRERVQEFKSAMSSEVDRRVKQPSKGNTKLTVSDVSTEVQRNQRDALQSANIASTIMREEYEEKGSALGPTSGEEKESIDEYITGKHQKKDLPRDMEMFAKHPPPQILIEFPKVRGWPTGINPVFAQKVLHRVYLDASASPWVIAASMRDGVFYHNLQAADLIKRWHGTEAMKILDAKGKNLKYGDIIDGRREGSIPVYDARIRSNFANNPNHAEVYFFGTTHVAIGFNDLSSLLAAKIQDKTSTCSEALRFVGFEMSEFAVAKCKGIARMLGSPEVSISSVMEVWLSSTWSKTTLTDFRKCLAAVLKSLDGSQQNPKVISYWTAAETISAAKARSEFFLNMERYNQKSFIAPSCFRREIDRLDLIQYMLTGEVRASSNVLNVLERNSAALLMRTLHSVDRLSVADLFVIHVMTNIRRRRDLMMNNRLTIDVNYGVVKAMRGQAANDPDNQKLLARIAKLRPYTISWSNVLYYFLPEDFHDLARRCSMHGDCMHYGYSMNWPTQVYGTSIIDYNPGNSKQLINTALDTTLGFLSSDSFIPSTMELFQMIGLDKLVLLPIRDHPLNGTGYVLAQIYKKHWIDHFM